MAIMEFFRERKLDVGVVFLGMVLGIFLGWQLLQILIFMVLIWTIIGPIRSQLLAGAALVFLFFVPLYLLLDNNEKAEEFAVYTYFFLVMTVIRGIIESYQNKTR